MESNTQTGNQSDQGRKSLIRLKCDLHTHVIGDLKHEKRFRGMLAPEAFIDLASGLGFDALSLTYHDYLYHDTEVWDYAKKKGIILIPGTERSIDRYHVLLLNAPHAETIDSFEGIRYYRRIFRDCLTIAPHPFYKSRVCLGKKLMQHIDCFDAIEYCHFYTRYLNPNRKAIRVAKRFGLPMIGCSDAHRTHEFGSTYSHIFVKERSMEGIIEAVKAGRVAYETSPLPLNRFIREVLWILTRLSFVLKGDMTH